jgi:hypothetical protein
MATWSELFLPSARHFREHERSIAGRVRRKNIAALEHAAESMGPCPLGGQWRTWDLHQHDFRHVSARIRRRCEAARALIPDRHVGRVKLTWVVASRQTRRGDKHCHAETTIEGRHVHVDYVKRTMGGPGRSLEECRIFVDGRLEGRGGTGGSAVGFGGSDLPALAKINESMVLTVDVVPAVAFPLVELWECVRRDSWAGFAGQSGPRAQAPAATGQRVSHAFEHSETCSITRADVCLDGRPASGPRSRHRAARIAAVILDVPGSSAGRGEPAPRPDCEISDG